MKMKWAMGQIKMKKVGQILRYDSYPYLIGFDLNVRMMVIDQVYKVEKY